MIVLILGPLAGALGLFVALFSTSIYRAEVLLAPAMSEESTGGLATLAGQFGGLASVAGINLGGNSDTVTAIATLSSRQFIIPYLRENELAKILFDERWDAKKQSWKGTGSQGEKGPTDFELYDYFSSEILRVSEDRRNGLVTLAIEWKDAGLASRWANDLSRRVNDYLRSKAKTEAEKNLEYLKAQLDETQIIEIRESLYSLIESQTQNAMLANAKDEFAFRIIDPAFAPERKIRPRRTMIVLVSGFLGGLLGIALCFTLHIAEAARETKGA